MTAYEDIGVADLDVVGQVTAALSSKAWRTKLRGEWPVAHFLVSRMAQAPKCRAADDLAIVCEWHPSLAALRNELAGVPLNLLLEQATGRGPLPTRSLALWYALGTEHYHSQFLRPRRGDPQVVFDALSRSDFESLVVEIAQEGFKKCRGVLCPLFVLLWQEAVGIHASCEADDMPHEEMIGEIPCWAYDMHVREGNRAMRLFLERQTDTARWIKACARAHERVSVLGGILFRVESGLVASRLRWDVGESLRQMVDRECHGLPVDATEVLAFLRRDLPELNEMRRHVVASHLR